MEHSVHEQCEMHAIVKGKVQGVGFRATTRHYAVQLGLKGTVRNLEDGSVEIYAQGSKNDLEELIIRLKQRAGLGHVEDAIIQYSLVTYPHKDFHIIK